ncbi:MAG: tetraacyldisaccharide 4'-kinase [Candidatus Omnitrophica bacterium]|nr:tetraacyldisaccharide 4'-kinase [Candidatus Omnitrophota bacterium]
MKYFLYNLATDKYRGFFAAIFKFFLLLLSFIYGLIVRVLIFFNRLAVCRLDCKVISVGNITLGGTGKTSLVEFITRYLKEKGRKVAVISRGYKRKAATMGDEPYMLSQKLGDVPVLVDPDRRRAAKQAEEKYGADTAILDDAFQQWRIKKDLEVVAIDATDPFGNRHLLPRGILREPLSSLKRADVFVLTKTNLNPDIQDIKDFLRQVNPQAEIFEAIHKPMDFYNLREPAKILKTDALKTKSVALFSGIGDPDSFQNLILSLGIDIGLSFEFPDHHNYTKEDLEKIVRGCRNKNIDTLVTTEKDAARLGALQLAAYNVQFFVLRIQLEIKDEQRFYNRLLKLYSL